MNHLTDSIIDSIYQSDYVQVKHLIEMALEMSLRDSEFSEIAEIALIEAVLFNDEEMVKFILDIEGVNIDTPETVSFNRETPLIIACRSNDVELVSILLEHGADPNVEVNGETALDYTDDPEIQMLLLSSGAAPVNDETRAIKRWIRKYRQKIIDQSIIQSQSANMYDPELARNILEYLR